MNKQVNDELSGIDQLLYAAGALGDHPRPHPSVHQSDRNNFHGYARTPPERVYSERELERERSKNDVGGEPRERHRPGGRVEHNRLEKDRRAQLKYNFTILKDVVPLLKDKKTSNQAILKGAQKCIQSLAVTQRKYEREIQELANEKSQLLRRLTKCKEEFDQKHNLSADDYLETLRENDPDDQASDATLSATECPDNYNDFEEDTGPGVLDVTMSQRQMPPPPPPSQSPRGIPHPVIRPVPPVNLRPTPITPSPIVHIDPETVQSATSAIPRATAKKLHAKLISTKQPLPAPEIITVTGTTSRAVTTKTISLPQSPGSLIRPRITSPPPVLPAGSTRVPLAPGRAVAQSLLSTPHGALVPGIFQTSTSTAGVMVPATVQANNTLLSAGVPRFNGVTPLLPSIAPLKDCPMFPRVIVATGDNRTQWMMNPPNVIVMSNTLPPHTTVSTHVAL